MKSIILIISIISYIIILLFHKKLNFLYYELLCATVYLFSLSFIQTLDQTIVIYLIFAILPYLKNFKIPTFIDLIFLYYFIAILALSIINNGLINATSVFIIRLIGILFFVYFFLNNKNIKIDALSSTKFIKILFLFVLCELFISFMAVNILGNSDRLMLNYQCTVGNISIAGILLTGYFLNGKKNNKLIGLIFALIFTFFSILSGTRGYIIICIALLLIYTMLYSNKIAKILGVLLLIIISLINFNKIKIIFFNITRLNLSIGRRTSENLLIWKYMLQNNFNLLFGFGFGKMVNTLPNISSFINLVSNSSYTNYILLKSNGFHNLYTTIFYSAGIIGIVLLLMLFLDIIKIIKKEINDYKLRITLIAFILLYFFVLWFRWTATSGILELSILGFIINHYKISNSNN